MLWNDVFYSLEIPLYTLINALDIYIYICRYTGCINMIHVCILTPTMKNHIDIMIIVMRHQHHKHHRQENNSPKDVRAGTPGSD